jgi:hypothetical protein
MFGIEWGLLYILLGSFVGFMAGLLGIYGSGILVPLLVLIFRYQGVSVDNVVHLALGTSLACNRLNYEILPSHPQKRKRDKSGDFLRVFACINGINISKNSRILNILIILQLSAKITGWEKFNANLEPTL